MNKILFSLSIVLIALCSCSKENEFTIYGEIADTSCDGAQIFLVPLTEEATAEVVDSVVIKDRKFEFHGNKAKVECLRLQMPQRMKFQELLVYTEPGVITAHVAQIGSVTGTKTNDLIQQWKGIQESCVQARNEALEAANGNYNTPEFIQLNDSLKTVMGKATYDLIKSCGLNPFTRFFYAGNKGNMNAEQLKDLDFMEKDLQHQLDSIRNERQHPDKK